MKNKLRTTGFVFSYFLFFLGFFSACSAFSPALSTDNMSKTEAREAVLRSMSGNTDGLLVLGLLIFLIIAVPIYIGLRAHQLKPK